MLQIIAAETESHFQQVREMFAELIEFYRTGPDAGVADLNEVPSMSGYEQESERLPGVYAPPEGRLLLALVDGEAAGCVAMKKFDDGICELKRLWVRPTFRGHSAGRLLVEALIQQARDAGYQTILLETEISLKAAHAIYEAVGFQRTEPYFDAPDDIQSRSLFMRLVL